MFYWIYFKFHYICCEL